MFTSDVNRITGLSGIDTDSLVEQMMKAESMKYDKLHKKKQWTTWQQTAYRGVISNLQKFQNTYFSTANPSTNFRYSTAFQNFKSTVMQNGKESSAITVNKMTQSGSYDIDIRQIAEKSSYIATQEVSKKLSGNLTMNDIATNLNNLAPGDSLDIKFTLDGVDGVSKDIKLTSADLNGLDPDSAKNLMANLNTKLANAFGTETVNGITRNKVKLDSSVISGTNKLSFDVSTGHSLSISEVDADRIGTKASINMDKLDSNGKFTGTPGTYNFEINVGARGPYTVDVKLEANDDAKKIANKINKALGKAKLNSDGTEADFTGSVYISANADGRGLEIHSRNSREDVSITNSASNGLFDQLSNSVSSGSVMTLKHTGSLVDIGFKSGDNNKIDLNSSIKNIFGSKINSSIVDSDGKFSLNINGTQIDLNVNDNLKTFMNKINKSNAGVDISYNNISEKFKIESQNSGVMNEIRFGDSSTKDFFKDCFNINSDIDINTTTVGDLTGETGSVALNINNKLINVNSTDTIQDLITAINGSGANVTFNFNNTTKEFSIESADDIKVDNRTSSFLNNLFKSHTSAKDAVFSVDGVETTRSGNDVDVNGLKFTINEVTNGTVTVGSEQDVDTTYGKIKQFVDDYNKLIEELNAKVKEKRAKSGKYDHYEPLTDDEKKAMTADEIKLWEEKAKTGLLYKDTAIQGLTSKLRSTLYESVDLGNGSKIGLYELGITTSSNYQDSGKLIIDEEKLKEAIKNRGSDIETLFTQSTTGLSDKLNKALESAIGKDGSLREKAGIEGTASVTENVLSKQLNDIDDKLADMKEYLYNKEMQYYKMFSAMENVINQQNNQLSALTSMFG